MLRKRGILWCVVALWVMGFARCTPEQALPTENLCHPSLPAIAGHPAWAAHVQRANQAPQGVHACLQFSWWEAAEGGSFRGSQSALVRMNDKGQLLHPDRPGEAPFSTLELPASPEHYRYRFRVFVFSAAGQSQRSSLCAGAMSAYTYACLGEKGCAFFYELRVLPPLFTGQTRPIEGDPSLLCKAYFPKVTVDEPPADAPQTEPTLTPDEPASPDLTHSKEPGLTEPDPKEPQPREASKEPHFNEPLPPEPGDAGPDAGEPPADRPAAVDQATDQPSEPPDGQRPEVRNDAGESGSEPPPDRTVIPEPPPDKPSAPFPAWLVHVEGKNYDAARDVLLTPGGDVYITGALGSDGASFGASKAKVVGTSDMYVAKLNSKGKWQWVVTVGAAQGLTVGHSIALGPQGKLYVAGTYDKAIRIGKTTLPSNATRHLFVASLDANGKWLWAVGATGTGASTAHQLKWDHKGNLALLGSYSGNVTLDAKHKLTLSDGLLLASISTRGAWRWTYDAKISLHGDNLDMAVAPGGELVVAFSALRTVNLPPYSLASMGKASLFVGKFNPPKLGWSWVVTGGSVEYDQLRGVAVGPRGQIAITGDIRNATKATFGTHTLPVKKISGYVALLDAKGKWQWVHGLQKSVVPYDVAIDAKGHFYVVGHFHNDLLFGGRTYNSTFNWPMFVLSFDATRLARWAIVGAGKITTPGAPDPNYLFDVDSQGNVAVLGTTENNAFGKYTLNNPLGGKLDLMVGLNPHR